MLDPISASPGRPTSQRHLMPPVILTAVDIRPHGGSVSLILAIVRSTADIL